MYLEISECFAYVLPGTKKNRRKLLTYNGLLMRSCDTDRTQTCNLLIRRHNSAIFADLRRFLFCFIIIWFSDANIAILFRFIFVGFD